MKDFHFQSLHENIKPCFFDLSTNAWASKVAVRITGNQVIQNLAALIKTENPGYPFEYRFLMPVGLAALIALPIAGWLMNRWLNGFAYRVTVSPWTFASAAAVLLAITLGTVGVTSIRAARANPVKSLRQV